MRPLVVLVPLLLLTAGEASAISRYQTTSMSCARIQAAVQADGAALLSYPARDNPSLQLFDRYVRDSSFCRMGYQTAQQRSVPASDTENCKVRKCVRVSGGNR
jgi:hypothetical protein